MSQEIMRQDQVALETQVVEPHGNLLTLISRAASDPTVDVQKWQSLLDMHERMEAHQAEREFKAALAQIQAVAPRVLRDGKIVVKGQLRSTYATFEAIDELLRPLTAEHGFSYRFTTTTAPDGKNMVVTMTVAHRGGHSETATMPVPVDRNDYRSDVQNVRSSITFAKRCLVTDFFNIVTVGEDNDGQGGYITDDQAKTIETMLHDTRADLNGFLKFAGAKSVKEISERDYSRCMNALKEKAARR